MAKIVHSTSIDSINELFTDAKKKGVMHLVHDSFNWSGHEFAIEGEGSMINFGTCGYLGLETDIRLREASARFAMEQGTQFSISRAYVSSAGNILLEKKLSEMFSGFPVVLFSSTTLAHQSIIPIIASNNDVIILDQQVHASVQKGCHLAGFKRVALEMIRHSNLEMLERKILDLRDKHDKIWYMIDGVYSMYGDLAPLEGLKKLMDKYPKLHLYVDDAHGMSWAGKNGTGTVFDFFNGDPRVMLVSILGKGFGAIGGVAVFTNQELYDKVHLFGDSLSHSHPLAPPIIGAAIASAEIHLSDEIIGMQNELEDLIHYCNGKLAMTNLPIMSNPRTPVYFVATGQPKVGFNFNKRLLDEGYYTSLGIFPAVPLKNTGMRFTITRHVTKQDINGFVQALEYHYPKALEEEGTDINLVRKAFKLPPVELASTISMKTKLNVGIKIQVERTIKAIDKDIWNQCFRDAAHDWNYQEFVEQAFTGNKEEEFNWDFYYCIVRDVSDRIILATFFSVGIFKDDVFARPEVSRKIEDQRKRNPYFLTSRTITLGSFFSEGMHLYLDKSLEWKQAIIMTLEYMSKIQDEVGANTILLRDFEAGDLELKSLLFDLGFAKIDMPNANLVEIGSWKSEEDILVSLSARNRRHIRTDVYRYRELFEIHPVQKVTKKELNKLYQLFRNVHEKNLAINLFPYPKRVFELMINNPNWEFLVFKLKKKSKENKSFEPVAVVFSFIGNDFYTPLIAGLDYDFLESHKTYKQLIYNLVVRPWELGLKYSHLGLSADIEKKKVGAKQIQKVAYFQSRDNFNLTLLENISGI